MHELSLAGSLVTQIEAIAEREQATEVLSVTVRIGALAGVDRTAFEFAFPVVAEGSVAQGATLKIEEEQARVVCRECGSETHPELVFLHCEECGSTQVDIVAGRSFLIQSLEVK